MRCKIDKYNEYILIEKLKNIRVLNIYLNNVQFLKCLVKNTIEIIVYQH